jgi:hypothetical protein
MARTSTSAASILRAIDEDNDTGRDDEEDAGDPDAGAPEDDDDRDEDAGDEAAGPNFREVFDEDQVLRGIRALSRDRDASFKERDLLDLVRHYADLTFKRHKRHVRRRRPHRRGWRSADAIHWSRSREMEEFRYDIIGRYFKLHQNAVERGKGHYYATLEVPFDTVGTKNDAAFTLAPGNPDSPVVLSCFDAAIDDTVQWIGGPHVLTPSDTNLQNPGQALWADEVFIIESIEAKFKGLRVKYDTSTMSPAPQGIYAQMLTAETPVWDANGNILPPDLFNPLSDECRIARALAETTTIYFTWTDKGVGGGRKNNQVLIDSFGHVPNVGRMSLRDTSGGGRTLDLPRGYIWTLDKQFQASSDTGGNGLFDAEFHVNDTICFPFKPIAVYGAGPLIPQKLAAYWEIRLWGTSLLPSKAAKLMERDRRRM